MTNSEIELETYRTDELENAIDYLEQAAKFYKEHSRHQFKWLMISLHGALYSFGVCAIQGSNPVDNVYKELTDKKRQEIIKSKRKLQNDPILEDYFLQVTHGSLLSIGAVIKRCQSKDYMCKFVNSKLLTLTDNQKAGIEMLTDFRNDFVHFKPKSHGYIMDYIVGIVMPVLEVIRFLALESNNIIYYGDKTKERVTNALNEFDFYEMY